jgi:raffinose/stachyose/melibiose transport system substrate-binding protein
MVGRRRRGATATGTALLAAVALAASGCSAGQDDDRTTLTFFQFKPEAVEYFQDAAARFEQENPDIRVIVDNVPDPETALRTRLVKEDVPDVLTLNANGTFGEFASAGIFKDFRDEPVLDEVNPGYIEVIQQLGASSEGAVNGVPFASNASGILYNEELFRQEGVEVPQTWTELVQAAETFQAAGITPFYGMLLDTWTPQSPLAPLTAQTQGEDFFEQRFADETTFREGWREAFEKLGTLFQYTQPDPGAAGYEDGTRAFAEGESAMLLLGSYAVPQIRSFEPDFTVGSFAFPATDDPASTTLVSGVDVVITAAADGAHPEESQRFIDFLMQRDDVAQYAAEQVAIPAVEGLENDDPALRGVQPYIDQERLVGFTDHQFIPAIPLAQVLQQYLIDGDVDAALAALDGSWDKVAQRRSWGIGAVES